MTHEFKDYRFSFLDIETTGFSPQRGDKVIEIGIVTTDHKGNLLSSYETLINPGRDIGPTRVHGITSEMIIEAPNLEDAVNDILEQLDGNIMVCHNAHFDLRFLNYELSKILADDFFLDSVCSLALSRYVLADLPSHKLGSLCEYFDISVSKAHSAYADAFATNKLFHRLLREIDPNDQVVEELGKEFKYVRFDAEPFYVLMPPGFTVTRKNSEEIIEEKKKSFSEKLSRLPTTSMSSKLPVQEYLNLLDEILLDRIVTEDESEKILDFASSFSMAQDEVIQIHEEYIRRLVRVYLLDEIITESEYRDLLTVSKLLDVEEKLNLIISLESAKINHISTNLTSESCRDYVGKSVCFTGELTSCIMGKPINRNLAQDLAMEKGLKIKSGVSRTLDYLVVADPNTQSSKARKARDLGVKILAESVFWNMVGINVE